jgi:4-hydroxymandelate oxidase
MGTIMVVSVNSTYSWEDIGEVASGPLWAQMYIYRDRELLRELIQRAEDSGYSAICVTVDSRVRGKRERDLRNKLQFNLSANYASLEAKVPADPNAPSTSEAYRLQDTSATWDDLEWVASNTKLPVTLKGVMTSEDAALAVEHGVKGIFVSNHGARQLDTASATIEVLSEIAEAVDGRLEVYLDGGIRRGTDVLKALALGARAVLMGRPIFWGLAVGGEAGVRSVLTMLRDELDVAMALTGQPCVAAVDSRIVDRGPSWT